MAADKNRYNNWYHGWWSPNFLIATKRSFLGNVYFCQFNYSNKFLLKGRFIHCGPENEWSKALLMRERKYTKDPRFSPSYLWKRTLYTCSTKKRFRNKFALFRLKPMDCLTPVFKNLFFSRRRIKFEFKIQKLEDFLFLAAAGSWSWLSLCKEMCKNRQITGPPFSRWGITGRCRHHLFCEKRSKNLQKKSF